MEYRNMQDNIHPALYNNQVAGVLNWIKENREKFDWAKEPNAYEMTNLFLLGAKYRSEGENINIDPLQEMWDIRSKDFQRVGISEQSFIYQICSDSFEAAKQGRALVNDEASHHSLRKMAGIGLFLKQQQAHNESIEYNNPQELLELINVSRTLKGIHPDLFKKYRFMDNLKQIVALQPENPLSSEINKGLAELQQEKQITSQSASEEKVLE